MFKIKIKIKKKFGQLTGKSFYGKSTGSQYQYQIGKFYLESNLYDILDLNSKETYPKFVSEELIKRYFEQGTWVEIK